MGIDRAHPTPRSRGGSRLLPKALGAPFAPATWRGFGYLLLGLPLSAVFFSLSLAFTALGAGLLVTFLGVPVLAATLAMTRGFGVLERARARTLLGVTVAEPEPIRPTKAGALGWMGAMLKSGVGWRHLLFSFLHFPWAVFAFCVSLVLWAYGWAMLTYPLWHWVFPTYVGEPGLQLYGDDTRRIYLDSALELTVTAGAGLGLTLIAPWVIRGLTQVDRVMVTGLLGPSRLAVRVSELESDRGVVVDTAAADLRRIERDLHDGAQARLVALAMGLGLAKEKLLEDPDTAAAMVDEAHGEVKLALQELRDLARGIHPAVLTDRGLDAALSAVATRCTVPVHINVDLTTRPAPAIEGIAYYTVSELLQNISKHAQAHTATVDIWRTQERLLIQVRDDGKGGANTTTGTGLTGLTERLGAVDGVMDLDSPVGLGTTVTAELPWRAA
ncbi:sensor histidine kinase [Streptomyces sp. NPDC006879]|uniref:sensor histidine kinase n=1 Tax=Streptomyces sp. NPDC006879 TaxID=3364767 RepID=UPI0036C273BA